MLKWPRRRNSTSGKAGLLAALLESFRQLEVSLQNILTFVGLFILPSLVTVLAEPMAIGISAGLTVVLWFVLLTRTLKYAKSKMTVWLFGLIVTILFNGAGVEVARLTRTPILQSPAPVTQKAEDCSQNISGNGNTGSVNCGDKAVK